MVIAAADTFGAAAAREEEAEVGAELFVEVSFGVTAVEVRVHACEGRVLFLVLVAIGEEAIEPSVVFFIALLITVFGGKGFFDLLPGRPEHDLLPFLSEKLALLRHIGLW